MEKHAEPKHEARSENGRFLDVLLPADLIQAQCAEGFAAVGSPSVKAIDFASLVPPLEYGAL